MPARSVLSARTLLTVLVALTMALAAVPALADPPDVVVIEEQFTDVDPDFCGSGVAVQIDVDVQSTQSFRLRGADRVAYYHEKLRLTETFTNMDTGASITHHLRALFKDLEISVDEDGLMTITVLGTGGDPWFGPDGKLVYNEPGQIRFQVVIDSNGTLDDPSDDTFVDDLGIVFGSTGRNDLQDLDFCDAILDVIG